MYMGIIYLYTGYIEANTYLYTGYIQAYIFINKIYFRMRYTPSKSSALTAAARLGMAPFSAKGMRCTSLLYARVNADLTCREQEEMGSHQPMVHRMYIKYWLMYLLGQF